MNLEYAVDRLYDAGWTPSGDTDVETLASGRPFPSLDSIRREFARAGLGLTITHNEQFCCYRATWSPSARRAAHVHDQPDSDLHGTVIGACEREAAVYALAQLRATQSRAVQPQLAGV